MTGSLIPRFHVDRIKSKFRETDASRTQNSLRNQLCKYERNSEINLGGISKLYKKNK